jgi:hypothetical protein
MIRIQNVPSISTCQRRYVMVRLADGVEVGVKRENYELIIHR